MNKTILRTGIITGALAVVLGAFGTHGLKTFLPVRAVQNFETGVMYQMYHALLLLFLGTTHYISPSGKKAAYLVLITGIVLFSGSIYLLTTGTIWNLNVKKIAFITPIGGVLLLTGWGILFWTLLKSK